MKPVLSYPLTDEILNEYRSLIKDDFDGYRNHVTRMLNFCHLLKPDMSDEQSQKLQIAAAFHDIGLWTHNRVDYLEPSIWECIAYLEKHNLSHWKQELVVIIDMHHYIKAYNGPFSELVELFRKADLVDFSFGLVKYSISSDKVKQVKQAIPNAGFHKTLMRFSWQQFKRSPINPLPMMRMNNKYR